MSNTQSKILIVSEYFYPEEFKINEVAFELVKRGYEVDVLTCNPTYPFGEIFPEYSNEWISQEQHKGVNITRIKSVTGYKNNIFKKILKYFSFMFIASFHSLKNHKKYDYVLGYDVGALTSMLPAILLNKFHNKKVTLWIQDIWPDSVYAFGFKKSKILKWSLDRFVKFIYKYTDNFGVSCPGFEAKVRKYSNNEKEIKFIPNWGDEINSEIEHYKFANKDIIQFTFAGNVGKFQNLENVISSFSMLPKEYRKKAQLNIIGDGSSLDVLKESVIQQNITNVEFLGRINSNEMPKYFNGSDILIISLIDEPIFSLTIPSKFQTYLSAGKPIFSIMKGEVSNMVDTYNLGIVSAPSDLITMTKGFKDFIDMPNTERQSLAINGKRLAESIFNKNLVIDEVESILCKH
jgi:glycosyltransferase involved in cell wall biosynthesis